MGALSRYPRRGRRWIVVAYAVYKDTTLLNKG